MLREVSDSAPHQPTHSPNRFGESVAKEPLVRDDNRGRVVGGRGGCHGSQSVILYYVFIFQQF